MNPTMKNMQLTYKRVWSGCSTVESKNRFNGEKEAKQGWPIDHISEYPCKPSHNPGIKQYKSYIQFEDQQTKNQYQIVIVGQIQDIQPILMRIQNRIYNQGIQDRPYQGHLKSQPMTTAWWQYEIKFLHHRMTFRICYNNQSWPKSHFHRSWEKSNNYKSILQSWKILKKQCYSLYLGIVPWDLVQKQSLSSRTISRIKEKCIYTRPWSRIKKGSC